MHIETIKVKNFKVLKNISLTNLPSFCVFVGANGVGKTSIFDIFGFLKDCLNTNVKRALQKRGGFKEVISRDATEQLISFEIQFRTHISNQERLVTYILELGLTNNQPTVNREILRYKRGASGKPYHFLDFANGKGAAVTNEEDFSKTDEELTREEQELDSPDILAIKGLGQFERFKAASAFRLLIENWYVSDFHISNARGSKDAAGFEDHLSTTGDNLQLVARNLYENHPEIFNQVIQIMKSRVPGITDIQTIASPDGRLLLSFQDGSFTDPFIDRYVSDGTIKMFAYLILLNDPKPFPLLCVEEPENQLYVSLLAELAEEFRAYAHKGGQVFVTTHSPDFLNATRLQEVFWLVKKQGFTEVYRASEDEQISVYMQQGDKMGYLWKQGFFEGADPL